MSRSKSRSRTSNRQSLNPWSSERFDRQFGAVQDMLSNTYDPYEGQLTAGISGAEQRAYDYMMERDSGGGVGGFEAREFERGPDYNPLSYENDFNPDIYNNPHAAKMIEQVQGDVSEMADRSRSETKAAAIGSGAYGGARHGVREALIDETEADAIADASARINFDSWNTGIGMFEQDAARHERAHSMNEDDRFREFQANEDNRFRSYQSDLANEQNWLDNLMSVGERSRSIEDRRLAGLYADYMRGYDDHWRGIQAQMGLLNSIPMLINSEGENVTTQQPSLLGVAGGLSQGLGAMFGAGGMFGEGGFFGS